ncbi:MAG: HAD family hydrolase [Prevotella sp.]|nr:HAD family hydrolase [Prevotella sp.]
MNRKEFKAALFDLDGVVFDTEPQYTVFWGGQCRLYYPQEEHLEQRIKGQTLSQIYDMLLPDRPEEQAKVTARLNDFERQMTFDYVAGFVDFVTDLRAHGVKTAIVTSSNQAKMENVYEAHPEVHGLFDAVLTSEDFERSKPDPDCYLKAAERLGATPEECIGFEDSFNGLKSVRAAGMRVVGLATTNSREAIEAYTDLLVDNYEGMDYQSVLDF